jgi:hypothetical protein
MCVSKFRVFSVSTPPTPLNCVPKTIWTKQCVTHQKPRQPQRSTSLHCRRLASKVLDCRPVVWPMLLPLALIQPLSQPHRPMWSFPPPLHPSNTNHILRTGCTDNERHEGPSKPKHCLPHPKIPFQAILHELASPPSCRTLCLASGTLHVLPLQDAKPRPIEATQDFMRKQFPSSS